MYNLLKCSYNYSWISEGLWSYYRYEIKINEDNAENYTKITGISFALKKKKKSGEKPTDYNTLDT